MTLLPSFRSGLLLTSACAVLAACSGGGSVQNAGQTGPITVGGGGSGGGTTTGADSKLNFRSAANACAAGTTETTRTLNGVAITACELTGSTLTGSLTIGGDGNVYMIAPGTTFFVGENLISNPTGGTGTLTILPGTILVGADSESTLVVSPGSQLIANGQLTAPIIMTSSNDLLDADKGDAAADLTALEAVSDGVSNGNEFVRGEWGGLVINGLAPINACPGQTGGTSACTKSGEGFSGLFGGNDPADNSGILSYVRVQYPGNNFSSTNELNGIGFQGVGSGTQVTNVQVHHSSDDGVEFFGGTVNVSNLVLTGNGDDSMDWTDGWQGSAQYVVVVHTDGDADNGFEGDNFGDNADATPQSTPFVSNFTIIGMPADPEGESDDGMELRAGVGGTFINGIVANMGEKGLDYVDESPALPEPFLNSVIFAGNSGKQVDTDADTQALFNGGANNRQNPANSLDGLFTGNIEEATVPTAITDSRLEAAGGSFVGAFPYSVRSISDSFLDRWTLSAPFPTSQGDGCPTGTSESPSDAALIATRSENRVCTLTGIIDNDVRLTRGNLYKLVDAVFVGRDIDKPSGQAASLTIDAGVTLFGDTSDSYIVVTRGSKIFSNGTAGSPITMTARAELEGTAVATDRGLWGGLVMNGRAPINACPGQTGGTAACVKDGEGFSGEFGGDDPTDNSGVLRYTSLHYPGNNFSSTNELNGIGFQGVGNGTTIDYLEVMNSSDDGVEFFGGTVNAKHLVLVGNGDDSLDWTDGWQGNVQYVIIGHTDGDADNGFEGDNFGDNADATPQSSPTIVNYTIVGMPADPEGESDDGMELRAGTAGEFYNGIVTLMGEKGLDYVDESPALAAEPILDGITFAANSSINVDTDADTQRIFATGTNATSATPVLGPDSEGSAFDLIPSATFSFPVSSAVDEDRDPATPNTFIEDAPYAGAVEDDADNWYVGWTFSL